MGTPEKPAVSATGPPRRARWVWLSWLFGVALVAAVAVVATHFSEERDFAHLLESAQPGWLLVAALLQLGTYAAEAGVWWEVLARIHARKVSLRSLVELSVAKLFLDQAVPSGGIAGTLLVVRGLERREVTREASLAAVLLDLRAFYAAYAAALTVALAVLWRLEGLGALVMVPAALFLLWAAAAVVFLGAWGRGRGLGWARRLPLRGLREQLTVVPASTSRDWLFAKGFGLELSVFLLDALTLWLMLLAVGERAPFARVLASFMVSSLARTLGPVPGGLGTFEAISVATLKLQGVPVAAALAATLLFRGYTFWLPMLPGLLFARRESRQQPAQGTDR